MNGRIFELIQRQNANALLWTEEDKEEFAMLIVRECVNISENHKGMNDKYFIADAIKKHFGVEE